MSFTDAKKYFDTNIKSIDVKADRAAFNLNQGLKLLTEAMAEADSQRAFELQQIKQFLAVLGSGPVN